jgi:uncharacterized membrane protein YphA (DoxX/SURF4 family)
MTTWRPRFFQVWVELDLHVCIACAFLSTMGNFIIIIIIIIIIIALRFSWDSSWSEANLNISFYQYIKY